MILLQGLQSAYKPSQSKVVTIGNFDGMHLGHRELISRVVATSRREKIPGGLITFDPHPLRVLAPARETKAIFELSDRIKIAEQLGVDFFAVEPFSRELSQLEPEIFFQTIILDKVNAKFLLVGHDFNFGRDRRGTLEVLKGLCQKASITLEVLPPVKIGDEIVSSTKIRDAISLGRVELANTFLGRLYSVKGVIEKGAGRGHQIGFPTANLFTSAELFPAHGVYITTFEVRGKTYRSVTNVGKNPTFLEERKRPVQVETYLLDFNEDIYGEAAQVNFLSRLRAELKFNSVNDLVAQIKKDVEQTRSYSWPTL